MPTYVYRRNDGSTFEFEQRITADPLEVCPDTGQRVERVITGAGLIFKGSGFYLTDYARKSENGSSSTDSPPAKDSKDAKDSKEPAKASKSAEPSESTSASNGKSEAGSKTAE